MPFPGFQAPYLPPPYTFAIQPPTFANQEVLLAVIPLIEITPYK